MTLTNSIRASGLPQQQFQHKPHPSTALLLFPLQLNTPEYIIVFCLMWVSYGQKPPGIQEHLLKRAASAINSSVINSSTYSSDCSSTSVHEPWEKVYHIFLYTRCALQVHFLPVMPFFPIVLLILYKESNDLNAPRCGIKDFCSSTHF